MIYLLLTILVYWLSKFFYKKHPKIYTHPIIITPALMLLFLLETHTNYASYNHGAQYLSKLLGPATIAFAVPLYKNWELIKKNAIVLLVSIFSGSMTAIFSSLIFAELMHFNHKLIESIIPRSVTTPIAMVISREIGGSPTLTAVFVVTTAVLGVIAAPIIVRLFHLNHSFSQGVIYGTAMHGIGTAKAFEIGKLEGSVSSVAMILSAIMTFFIALFFK